MAIAKPGDLILVNSTALGPSGNGLFYVEAVDTNGILASEPSSHNTIRVQPTDVVAAYSASAIGSRKK